MVGSKGLRTADSTERETLHGFKKNHTYACWNRGDARKGPIGFEDARKILGGQLPAVPRHGLAACEPVVRPEDG